MLPVNDISVYQITRHVWHTSNILQGLTSGDLNIIRVADRQTQVGLRQIQYLLKYVTVYVKLDMF